MSHVDWTVIPTSSSYLKSNEVGIIFTFKKKMSYGLLPGAFWKSVCSFIGGGGGLSLVTNKCNQCKI